MCLNRGGTIEKCITSIFSTSRLKDISSLIDRFIHHSNMRFFYWKKYFRLPMNNEQMVVLLKVLKSSSPLHMGKLGRIRQFSHWDTTSRNLSCFLFCELSKKVLSLAVSQPKKFCIFTSCLYINLLIAL